MKKSELQQIIREEVAKATSKRTVNESKTAKQAAKKIMDLLNNDKIVDSLVDAIPEKDPFWKHLNKVEDVLFKLLK